MGFLLIQHELLRAKAKVNNLTLAQTRFKSKQERIQKAIQKKEEYFNHRKHALENQFRDAKSGLTNAINGGNWAYVGGALQLPPEISDILSGLYTEASATNKYTTVPECLNPNGDGTYSYKEDYVKKNPTLQGKVLSEAEMKSMQADIYLEQQRQLQQLKSYYMTIMDQFLESMKEAEEQALEDEKDAALEPLNEEENDMDIKISTNELQLTEAKEYRDSLKEELKERVKDSTPKFGLG